MNERKLSNCTLNKEGVKLANSYIKLDIISKKQLGWALDMR